MAASTVLQRIDMNHAPASSRWPVLALDEIHLWHVASAAALPSAALHGLLDRFLCHYADLDTARVERDARGKPWLGNCPRLHFNISHSGASALLAFAWDQPLGVDAEQGLRLRAPLQVAQRFFHEDEAAQLAALPIEHQREGFLSLWAGKEAILKSIGQGLSWGLDRIVLRLDGRGDLAALQRIDGKDAADWQLVAIDLPGPGRGALAWQGRNRLTRPFRIGICKQG